MFEKIINFGIQYDNEITLGLFILMVGILLAKVVMFFTRTAINKPARTVKKYTSLHSTSNGNYQTDYSGIKESVLGLFDKDCREREVNWSYLFETDSGDIISIYTLPEE